MPAERRSLVLVVEDQALIRMHGCDLLEDAGFEVLEAASADEAIEILEKHDVHLLFSDIDMPGSMDGLELAELVHTRWPSIGLLITSGRQKPDEASLPDDGKFVPKPWRESDILDRVRTILLDKPGIG